MKQIKNHVLLLSMAVISSYTVTAQNYAVTSNADTHAATPASSPLDGTGQITLRSAIEASTAIAGTHIITIPGSITAISLSLGQITVGSAGAGNNITINGPGKNVLTITQTTANRVFSTGTGAVTFSLNDLTLNYGYAGIATSYSGGGGAIQAGGTGASTSLNNVAITNFKQQAGNGGALICSSAGTANALSVTNCDFTGNTCGGLGGAIYFTTSTSGTISNCTFTNNSTTVVGGGGGGAGGAIGISGPAAGGGTCTITKCTFTGNRTNTNAPLVQGGAIVNVFGVCTVSFCRFINNTTASLAGSTIYEAGGGTVGFEDIVANNNWWGVNGGPGASDVAAASGGTATASKWLQLKVSASPSSLCTSTTSTVTASFLTNSLGEAISSANLTALVGLSVSFVNPVQGALSGAQSTIQSAGTATVTYTASGTAGAGSVNATVDNVPNNDATAKVNTSVVAAPSISVGPSASTSCAGLAVTFTATVSNQTGITWQESADLGFTTPTTLSNTGIYSGTATNTLTISDNTGVSGKYYRLIATNGNGCGNSTSTGVLLTATSPVLSTNNTATQNVGNSNNIYYAASCGAICKVVPSGATPVSGSVTTQVWVEGAVPTASSQPFVQRHYQITPATGASTATGTVTLYFSQAEFDNFNAHPSSALNLPTGTADAAGKANLRVAKYPGTTTNGTGLPGTYGGSTVVITDPPDANIVWNASFSRWEVTLDVSGFSGFIVQTATVPLAVRLTSFTAQYTNNTSVLKWQIAQAEEGSTYELQRSASGSSFVTINSQQGDAVKTQFSYNDPLAVAGKWYYRVQITDRSGKITYSDIVFVRAGSAAQEITVYPNPVKAGQDILLNLQNVTASKIELSNIAGQQIWSLNQKITGSYNIRLPFVMAKGMYMIKIYTGDGIETRKVMVE